MKCITIEISGKVQGVWFRASTQRKANELGVKGTVKNLPNGNVFVVAEGEEKILAQLVEWCHEGSELSRVDKVEVNEIENQGFNKFKII